MLINIFGDFVANDVDSLQFSPEVSSFVSNADFNVVNFEAPVKEANSKAIIKSGPTLCQNDKAPQWLEQNKFNIITLANNHIFDYGHESLNNTIDSFKSASCIGAGDWEKAYSPLIIEKGGVTVGIIALTHCEFGTLCDKWDKTQKSGTAWINNPSVPGIIKKTKDKVDVLIVIPHAGVENIEVPIPEYRDLYKSFIDYGADAVVASHPHIIQGFEYYKSKPIYYSLGNFYFPWGGQDIQPTTWYKGLCLSFDCSKEKIGINYHFTTFDDKYVLFEDNRENQERLNKLNSVFSDNDMYMSSVNKYCLELLETYYKLFYHGGLVNVQTRDFFKRTINILLKRSDVSLSHLLNNIQCESHRYAISRALKLKLYND